MGAASLLAKKNCLKNEVSKRIERTAGRDLSQMLGTLRSKKIRFSSNNQESGKVELCFRRLHGFRSSIPSFVLHIPSFPSSIFCSGLNSPDRSGISFGRDEICLRSKVFPKGLQRTGRPPTYAHGTLRFAIT